MHKSIRKLSFGVGTNVEENLRRPYLPSLVPTLKFQTPPSGLSQAIRTTADPGADFCGRLTHNLGFEAGLIVLRVSTWKFWLPEGLHTQKTFVCVSLAVVNAILEWLEARIHNSPFAAGREAQK